MANAKMPHVPTPLETVMVPWQKFKAWDMISRKFTTSGIFFDNSTMQIKTIPAIKLLFYSTYADINGFNICEGDILRKVHRSLPRHERFVEVIRKGNYFTIKPNITTQIDTAVLASLSSEFEIIDNALEHPELLEK